MALSYDGTDKSSVGMSQKIDYWKIITPEVQKLKDEACAVASEEALLYLDIDGYNGPDIEIDAATMTADQWQARRQNHLGGSDCGTVFGANEHKSNLELFYEKTGMQPRVPEVLDAATQRILEWGHLAESFTKLWVQTEFPDCKVITDTNIYSYPGKPYITANIDGIMEEEDGSYTLLEYKTSTPFNKDKWKDNNVPMSYLYQVRLYMAILGVWKCKIICVFDRDNVVCNTVYRDLDEEMQIIQGLEDFWENHVLPKIPPEALGSPALILETLKKYSPLPVRGKSVIQLNGMLADACKEYCKLAEEKSLLNKRLDAISDRQKELSIPVLTEMGDHGMGRVEDNDNIYVVKNSTRKSRPEVDLKKMEKKFPDAFKECVTPRPEGTAFSIVCSEK